MRKPMYVFGLFCMLLHIPSFTVDDRTSATLTHFAAVASLLGCNQIYVGRTDLNFTQQMFGGICCILSIVLAVNSIFSLPSGQDTFQQMPCYVANGACILYSTIALAHIRG